MNPRTVILLDELESTIVIIHFVDQVAHILAARNFCGLAVLLLKQSYHS